jgi:hypothetical protein
MITTVWDPPEYVMRRSGSDRVTAQRVLRAFGAAVAGSRRCSVMSEAMGRDYERRYGANPVVMRVGIPRTECYAPRHGPWRQGEAVICFAGDLYAESEWWALLSALASSGYRVGDRDIRLRVIGSRASFRSSVPLRAEYLGRRSASETIRLMAEADVAYVPYWFDPAYALAAQQSFPTKISTAVGAGTPVLFHGPHQSSVTDLMRDYPIGVSCSSYEPSAILGAIRRLLDADQYAACAQAILSALQNEFSMEVFLRRFADLLSVDERELVGNAARASAFAERSAAK